MYLFLSGTRLELLFLSFFLFRVLETFVFMPASVKINKKINYKILFLTGIVLTIIYQFSFFLAKSNSYFLILTVLAISISDVLYWPLRKNLQRETVKKENVSRGVGVSQAMQICGEAGGVFFSAYLLYGYDNLAFYIGPIGLLMSFIPIILIRTNIKFTNREFTTSSFFKKENLYALKASKTLYVIQILVLIAILHEIIEFFLPLFISYFSINILEVGTLVGIFFIINFISNLVTGEFENQKSNVTFYFFSIGTLLVLMAFILLPKEYIAVFVVLFGLFSAPLVTSIICKGQKFMKKEFGSAEGGFLLEFIDDASRILAYIIPLVLFLFNILDEFKIVLLTFGSLVVILLIYIVYKYDNVN